MSSQTTTDFSRDFVTFACAQGALRFGEFLTKSGRNSPYFFNAGLFARGSAFARLCAYYAQALTESGIAFDMLFGPAYKGIPLASGTAMALAQMGRDVTFCYNRKEAKDHGEGGQLVGAPLAGRVVIIDDVITAGTSVRESVEIIRNAGAQPAAVLIALDRQERGQGKFSAVEEVEASIGIPVIAVARLTDLIAVLANDATLATHLSAVQTYRECYGTH